MALARPRRPGARVTLVPLIDVLFILLVYFMVTSVYLDLDMIPAAGGAPLDEIPREDTAAPGRGDGDVGAPAAASDGATAPGGVGGDTGGGTGGGTGGDPTLSGALLVRIAPDGVPVLRGERLAPAALEARLRAEATERPGLDVILLPSPRAPVQALATALDALARAGVTRSRVLRLEGEE